MTAESYAGRGGGVSPNRLPILPRALFDPRRPAIAIAVGWLTAFGPSILLAALVGAVLPDAPQPEIDLTGPMLLFGLVIFAPVVETLIMGTVLLVLLRLVGPVAAVAISAIGWGIAHSAAAAAWGLVIWWPFLVFSALFVTWRQRSMWAAFAMPMIVHALHNLPTTLILLAAENGYAT